MTAPSRLWRPAAVVVGLDCITGLQTARILARRSVPVIGVASDPGHPCARTRVCQRVVAADTAGEALIDALVRLGQELGERAVLYPCTDASVMQIARQRERLAPWFHVVLADTPVLERLQDKLRFHAFAEAEGLPVPRGRLLHGRADALRASAELRYPCVLKPPVKSREWVRHTSAKVFTAETADELIALYDRCASWADALFVQEWIPGPDSALYSCNCYFDRAGRPVATFVARKLRQWPPHTGISSLGEECRNDEVLETTLRLFRAAGYRGLGYVEMKQDARTGRHYLIEANVGRPTGRSAIAEAGGVEMLYAMYCDAVGVALPHALEQHYGDARWIYFRQDARSAWYDWRRGAITLRDWARSWRGRKVDAVFAWSDPLPFVLDLLRPPLRALRERAAGRRPAPVERTAPPAAPAAAAPTVAAMKLPAGLQLPGAPGVRPAGAEGAPPALRRDPAAEVAAARPLR